MELVDHTRLTKDWQICIPLPAEAIAQIRKADDASQGYQYELTLDEVDFGQPNPEAIEVTLNRFAPDLSLRALRPWVCLRSAHVFEDPRLPRPLVRISVAHGKKSSRVEAGWSVKHFRLSSRNIIKDLKKNLARFGVAERYLD